MGFRVTLRQDRILGKLVLGLGILCLDICFFGFEQEGNILTEMVLVKDVLDAIKESLGFTNLCYLRNFLDTLYALIFQV